MPVTSPVAQAGVTWVPVYLANTVYEFMGATENIVLNGPFGSYVAWGLKGPLYTTVISFTLRKFKLETIFLHLL